MAIVPTEAPLPCTLHPTYFYALRTGHTLYALRWTHAQRTHCTAHTQTRWLHALYTRAHSSTHALPNPALPSVHPSPWLIPYPAYRIHPSHPSAILSHPLSLRLTRFPPSLPCTPPSLPPPFLLARFLALPLLVQRSFTSLIHFPPTIFDIPPLFSSTNPPPSPYSSTSPAASFLSAAYYYHRRHASLSYSAGCRLSTSHSSLFSLSQSSLSDIYTPSSCRHLCIHLSVDLNISFSPRSLYSRKPI